MMKDRFLIRAYWGPRKETVADAARRLRKFLVRIGGHSELLKGWYQKTRCRSGATETKLNTSMEDELVKLFLRGRNRDDITGEVIEDLGFRVGLWNGRPRREVASLSVTCGLYSDVQGVGVNGVLIDLPEDLGPLSKNHLMSSAFRDLIECWEPRHACVCSELAIDGRSFDANVPFVDWMLYVSELAISSTSVPYASAVSQVLSGTMIVVEDRPADALSPEHLSNVEQIGLVIESESAGPSSRAATTR